MTSPTAATLIVGDDLIVSSILVNTAGIRISFEGSETVIPSGSTPVAVAVLTTSPASRSAWVTVCSAVHRAMSPGARVATSQTIVPASATGSARVTLVTVTLPALRMVIS